MFLFNCFSFDPSKDEVLNTIAVGGFGKVERVVHDGVTYARKSIKSVEFHPNEVNLLKTLKHPNVIKVLHYRTNVNKCCYIYTKLYDNGDLWDLIDKMKKKRKDFTNFGIIRIMKGLISGLKYIHSKGIIHRDLKPGNILIGDNEEPIICDFGLAINSKVKDKKPVGTLNFIAPELWTDNPPYSYASDIFALGCIFYEMYTLRILFDGKNIVENFRNKNAENIENDQDNQDYQDNSIYFKKKKEEYDEKIVESIKGDYFIPLERDYGKRCYEIESIIEGMLGKDPQKRYTLTEVEARLKIIEEVMIDRKVCINFNFTQYIYLYGGYLTGVKLDDICNMSKDEFQKFWEDKFIIILFPSINQNEPLFTIEDALELKNRKNEYREDLYKLLKLIKELPNYETSLSNQIKQFLINIDLPLIK